MDKLSVIKDKRIGSDNYFVEFSIGEYIEFANDILENNEYQRKRVRKSNSVYSLLKADLKIGCVIPPIVLAITEEIPNTKTELLQYIITNKSKVKILDGLQRTYTILDACNDLVGSDLEAFKKFMIRFEIYSGINKFGILYRMLTLNTGQTPMSTRHQIEILYKDIIGQNIDGMKIVSEMDGRTNDLSKEFKFSYLIEGVNSYLNRSELPISRQDILDNIKMLDNLAKENVNQDVFMRFSKLYFKFFSKICNDGFVESEGESLDYIPFGDDSIKVFNTSQALTGFGAAVGKMIDFKIIADFDELNKIIDKLEFDDDEWFFNMLDKLNEIKNEAKKIGNSQRMYFQYFYREVFNKDGDSYLNLFNATENGYQKYLAQV